MTTKREELVDAPLRGYTADELRRDLDAWELDGVTTTLWEGVRAEIVEVVRERGLRAAVAHVSAVGVGERAAIAVVADAMARGSSRPERGHIEYSLRFWRETARAAQQALVTVGRRGQALIDTIMERALPGEVAMESPDPIADAVVVLRRLLRERDAEHGRALDLREVEEFLECGEGEAPVRLRAVVGELAAFRRLEEDHAVSRRADRAAGRAPAAMAETVRRAHREMLAHIGDVRSEVFPESPDTIAGAAGVDVIGGHDEDDDLGL